MTQPRLLALFAALLGGLVLTNVASAARLEASPRSVTVSPSEGADVRLLLVATDADGQARRGLRFLAESNFGSVGAVEETAPGRYEAPLNLPPTDMPRSALVLFSAQESESIELHHAIVPVTIATELRARTEPRSQITLETGGRSFGPVPSDRTGWFTLPFEQKVGTEFAEVSIVDGAGNVKRSRLPVPLRAHDALTVTLDRYRVASDGRGRVRVHALVFDVLGRPVPGVQVEASVDRGSLSEFVDQQDGIHGAQWLAPADGMEGVATLRLRVRQGGSVHEEIERISIVRGPAGRLALVAEPSELVAGELQSVALNARVSDAAGNGLPGQALRLSTDRGRLEELRDLGDGNYASRLMVPEDVGSGSIEVKALLVEGAPERPPAKISVSANPEVVPTSWLAFSLITATVTDEAGAPVQGEVLLFHVARGEGVVTPTAVTNAEGRAFADFSADPTDEVVAIEVSATSVLALKGQTRIEKRSSGEFAIINRPARAAQGDKTQAVYEFSEEHRVLEASALIIIRPGAPASLSVSTDPSELIADGRSTSRVSALLKDARGNEIPQAEMRFAVDVGTISEGSNVSNGSYLATYTSPEGRGDGRATVTVTEAGTGLSASTVIELEVGPPAALALVSDRDELPADGVSTARLTATLQDASGQPVPDATLRFRSEGAEVELARSATTDAQGVAEIELIAGRDAGEVQVTAEVGEGLSASVALSLLPTEPVELTLTATPASIRADGAERSELSAELLDPFGQAVVGHSVEFRVSEGPGRLSATTARTDSLGLARTWLSSTSPGEATVTARSLQFPSLDDEAEVELRPAALLATFEVEGPACALGVQLVSTSEPTLSHEWDWTGDGAPDATGSSVLAPLPAGRSTVRLRVVDAEGGEAASEQIIEVLPAPVAHAAASSTHVALGQCVELDGSGSTLGGPGPLDFAWDLDGDGSPDESGALVPSWCASEGTHEAVLTVSEPSGCESRALVEVVFGDIPDLVVAVAAPGVSLPLPAGSSFEIELRWGNQGRAPAPSTVLVLQVSPELSPDGPPPAGATDLGGGRLRFALGDLAAGAAGSFRVPLRATDAPALPSSLAQVEASIRHAVPGGESTPVEATLTLPIVPAVNLSLSCNSVATAKPGEAFSVDLSLRNLGASVARDAALELSWRSDQLELVASVPPGTASPEGLRLDWPAIAGNSSEAIHLSFRVRAVLPATDNSVRISASAFHSGIDVTPGDESCVRVLEVSAAPDAWVTVRATPDRTPARPGDTILYELLYGNRGSTAALGVVVEGRFDTGVFESSLVENPNAGIFSGASGTIRFLPGRLPADATRQHQLHYRARIGSTLPSGSGEVRTEASIQHVDVDSRPIDDSDFVTVPLASAPLLLLAVDAPASVDAGSSAAFVLTLSSVGDVPAEDVVVDYGHGGASAQVLPGTLPPGATLLPGGGVRFTVGTMAVGGVVQVRHELRTDSPQPSVDPTLRNDWTASFGAAGAPQSVQLQRDVAVDADAELALDLQLSNATAAAGEQLSASVTLTASGEAPSPAGTIDLGCDAALFLGLPPAGVPFPALVPGDSVVIGPWPLRVQAVLPAPRTTTSLTATVTGTTLAASRTLVLTAAPSVEVRVASLPAEAAAGDWVDVTLAHRNLGTTAATGVLLSLADAAGASGLFAEFAPTQVALADIPADGVERSVPFRARLVSTLSGCRVPASLLPRATMAEAPGFAQGPVSFLDVLGEPDLRLELSARPSQDPPGPNDFITYEFRLTNSGNAPALGPSVTLRRDLVLLPDVLPPLPSGAVLSGADVVVPFPDLAVGASATRTVRMRVAADLPQPSNPTRTTADAAELSCETRVGDNSVGVTTIIGAVADLVVSMDVRTDPSELDAGASVGITLFLSNTGTTDAENVDLSLSTDQFALISAILDDGGADSVAPGSLSWTGMTVLAGEPPLLFDVALDLSETLPEVAQIFALRGEASTTSPENQVANNSAQWSRIARGWADLCLDLTAAPIPQPAAASGRIDYLISVRNDGATTARGTLVSLDYDAALMSPQGGGADPFTWPAFDLAPGATVDHRQTFVITNSIPGGTATASALASATSPEHDAWGLATCNPLDSNETVITDEADLAITKSLSWSDPVLVRGSLLDYSLSVQNVGNSDADLGGPSVGSVEDLIPSGLLVRNAGGGTWDGTTLRWDLPGSLRRGEVWTANYQLEIDAALPPGIHRLTNRARVLPAGVDATTTNDDDSATVELRFDVDLTTRVSCTAVPSPATPGSLLAYEVVVDNLGAYDATNVSLSLDGGSSLVFEAPLSGSGVVLVPGPASLPAKGRWVFRFAARSIEAFADPLTVVSLSASASSAEADADPLNDRGETACSVLASVDMRVSLALRETDGTPPAGAGEDLDVSITVENVGSRIETGIDLLLEFDPSLVSFVSSADFVEEAPGRLRHVHGSDFDPRDPPELLNARLRAVDVLPTSLELFSACASLSSPGPDIFPSDNRACRQLQLFASPDLRVSRTATTPSTPARPGEAITHDLLVQNLGTTAATGVVLEHQRDATRTTGLLPGSASHPASEAGNLVLLDLGSIGVGPGAAVSVSYQVGIAAVLTAIDDSAPSTACASASEADANPADDCSSLSVAIEALPDATVALRIEPSTGLLAGSNATAFIDYGNSGSSPLVNPVLRLELDPSVLLVGGSGGLSAGPLVLSGLPDLAPGDSRQEIVALRLASSLPQVSNSLAVTASVQHAGAARDRNAGNDSATVTLGASGQVDLVATLAKLSPAAPQASDLVLYQVGWRNAGSTTATGVRLTLAPELPLLQPDGSPALNPDVRGLPDLAPGASGSLQISYRLPATFPQELNTVSLSASLASAEPESVPADNVASLGFQLTANPDVRVSSLSRVSTPDPAIAGGTLRFTATHDNHGTSVAHGTQLVFTFDTSVAALIDAGGGVSDGAQRIVFDLGSVPVTAGPASTSSILLRAHDLQAGLTQVLSVAAEISATNEPAGAAYDSDNRASQGPTVFAEPDLVVDVRLESSAPSPAEAGGTLTFLTSVRNLGSTRAANVTMSLAWDESLIAGVIDDGGGSLLGTGAVAWAMGTISPGAPALERRLVLQVAPVLPTSSQVLTVDALATSVDSDANPTNSAASATATLLAAVDIVLSASVSPAGSVGNGAFVFYSYAMSNVGTTAAQDPCVRSAYDNTVLVHQAVGGTNEGSVIETCYVGSLAPGAPPRQPLVVMFQANSPGTGEIRREIERTHEAAERGKTVADDRNPIDNVRNTTITACFLSVTITSPSPATLCQNSSITLVANPSTEAGVTYQWSSASGGSFDDATARVVTFTPPTTAGVYPVHVRITHSSGCTATTNNPSQNLQFPVRVVTDCTSCGCQSANLALSYVAGTLERIDAPGSRTVAAGETVAFRLRVADTGTGKSAMIRTGTTLSFSDAQGTTYTAALAHPVFFECRLSPTLSFVAAQVPPAMAAGSFRPSLLLDTLDACGNETTRNRSVSDDVTVRPFAGRAPDPDLSFSNWGP